MKKIFILTILFLLNPNLSSSQNPPLLDEAEEWNKKGLVEIENKNFSLASKYFTKAISIVPAAWFYRNRATAYEKNGEIMKAISDYNYLIKEYPDSDNNFVQRGCLKNLMYDYRGAILGFDKAINIRKYSEYGDLSQFAYFAKLNKAGSLNKLERYGEGLKLLEKLILDCEDEIKYGEENGQCENTVSICYKAKYILPHAYLEKGISEIYLNFKEKACLSWSKAGELGNIEAYYNIRENCN